MWVLGFFCSDRLFFGYSRLKMSEKKVWSFPTDMVPTQIEKSLSDRKMSRHFFRHFFLGHFLRTNHTHTFFFRHFFRQIMKCLWKTNSHTQKFRLFFRQKKSVGTKKNHELTHSTTLVPYNTYMHPCCTIMITIRKLIFKCSR